MGLPSATPTMSHGSNSHSRVRMLDILRAGAQPVHEIAGEVGATVDAVKKAVQRDAGKRFVKLPGTDGVYRIALAERPR